MLEWLTVLDLYAELRQIAEALDEAGITYAVVGGLAVSIYTTPRATEDIDLLVAHPDVARAAATLTAHGFRAAGRPMRLVQGRLEIQRLTKIDGADLLPVDLISPLSTELAALLEDRHTVDLAGRPLSIIGVAGLRTLKRLRGSTVDRADLEALGEEP